MANIYKILTDTLKGDYPVREQGAFAANETLPETFITYQLIDEPDTAHYDNEPVSKTSRFQVALYSKDPALKQGADALFRSVMITAGFLRSGGRDLPYDKGTGHYGYASDYRFYETEV